MRAVHTCVPRRCRRQAEAGAGPERIGAAKDTRGGPPAAGFPSGAVDREQEPCGSRRYGGDCGGSGAWGDGVAVAAVGEAAAAGGPRLGVSDDAAPPRALPATFAKLVGDAEGHALCRALQRLLPQVASKGAWQQQQQPQQQQRQQQQEQQQQQGQQAQQQHREGWARPSADDPDLTALQPQLLSGFHSHLGRRAVQVLRSAMRARGLLKVLRGCVARLRAAGSETEQAQEPGAGLGTGGPAGGGGGGGSGPAEVAGGDAAAVAALDAACCALEGLYAAENVDELVRQLLLRDQQRDAAIVRVVLLQEALLGPLQPVTGFGITVGADIPSSAASVASAPPMTKPLAAAAAAELLGRVFYEQMLLCARAAIVRRVGLPEQVAAELRVLGRGQEGVVLSGGAPGGAMDKHMWHVAARVGLQEPGRRAFLRELPKRVARSTACLYGVHAWVDDGPAAVVSYGPYEHGTTLSSITAGEGGDGEGHMCPGRLLIQLARDCAAAGLVLHYVHPRNLLLLPPPASGPVPDTSAVQVARSSAQLRMLDVGCDWAPVADPRDVDRMLRKLYLCWRWWRRTDLDELLRASLSDDALERVPELRGFARFRAAVHGAYDSPEVTLQPLLCGAVREMLQRAVDEVADPAGKRAGARVLDYGAGTGKLLTSLHRQLPARVSLVGCDPAVRQPKHWDARAAAAEGRRCAMWTQDCAAAARSHEFDVVVCSLVLCVLEDPEEYDTALAGLRTALRPPPVPGGGGGGGGTLLLAVCNPFFTQHGGTMLQRREAPGPAPRAGAEPEAGAGGASPCGAEPCRYMQRFTWTKQLRAWGGRSGGGSAGGDSETVAASAALPCAASGRAASRLDVHRPLQALLLDLARLGLQLVSIHQTESCDPDRLDQPASDFLLLALRRVLHLTSQLADAALPFAAVTVAVDPHPGTYARQHARPDPAALLAALADLQRLGVLDEVLVTAPDGSDEVEALNERCGGAGWFGLRGCRRSHAAPSGGAAVAPPVLSLERVAEAHGCEFVLQVDCDMLIARYDSGGGAAAAASGAGGRGGGGGGGEGEGGLDDGSRDRSYLRLLVECLQRDPAAVTASLDAAASSDGEVPPPPATFCGPAGPWRTEVRGCLLHLPRLLRLRPLPVAAAASAAAATGAAAAGGAAPASAAPPPWHRALDAAVRASRGGLRSYRGACGGLLVTVHPPNATVKAPAAAAAPTLQPPPAAFGSDPAATAAAAAAAVAAPPPPPVLSAAAVSSAAAAPAVAAAPPVVPSAATAGSAAAVAAAGAETSLGGGGLHAAVLWDLLYTAVEAGAWPAAQAGAMDVVGGVVEWAAAMGRREELVVVVCGRNVPPGRFGRCMESLAEQVRSGLRVKD
ncbi:hypothetical protein TSOC_012849 [Tetrabaena socialis]|uniref:Methyltransferase type 12 domain-containing protein n=1 Tax=Tetrabaena socialis TaxID=47790 RepID=A0A2J7ZLY5_9CHLO|nr:hypothetical protein TSOC_012849 [Tetrabaena socialis]|eukprot:PNH01276.1 hypothetical protein TSOC_012849 [Tetrabaena socialis]